MTEHHHDERATCRELLKSLSDFIDGNLDESLCVEIEKHMAECDRCQVVVDTLRKTVELYQNIYPAPPVPDEVRQRLFVRLNLDDFLSRRQPEH
ncbi:MAG: anti-sigma factor [Chloroflexi bacterium]|nr:anti-sigma factor [Chloroflexota bacterium]MCL5276046.1 anti-sigma factor [Chloroflexota bacterium]